MMAGYCSVHPSEMGVVEGCVACEAGLNRAEVPMGPLETIQADPSNQMTLALDKRQLTDLVGGRAVTFGRLSITLSHGVVEPGPLLQILHILTAE